MDKTNQPKDHTIEHPGDPIIKTSKSGHTYPYYPKPDDFVPVEDFPAGHRWEGSPRCQAWSKQAGRQCLRRATRDRDVCAKHGGATPSGIASANFRHGKYVSSLPVDLVGEYQRIMNDDDYLALRDEIALVSARINQVLADAYGEGFPDVVMLRKAMDAFDDASRKAQSARTADGRAKWINDANRYLDQVRALIHGLDGQRAAWGDIESMSNTLRRLVDTERKRVTEGKAMMRADDALTRATMLAQSVKRHVDDPAIIAAIWQDFQRIMKGEPI